MSNSYMFEAQPRPVQSGTKTKTATKAKYRDPADTLSGDDTPERHRHDAFGTRETL